MTKNNHKFESESHFHTLIINIWGDRVQSSNTVSWQFRLRDVRSDEYRAFTTLAELVNYLENQFGETPDGR